MKIISCIIRKNRKSIVAPPMDKELFVSLHPELADLLNNTDLSDEAPPCDCCAFLFDSNRCPDFGENANVHIDYHRCFQMMHEPDCYPNAY